MTLTETPTTVADSDVSGSGAAQEAIRRYVRSPEDVLRLVVYTALTLVLLALTL